MASSAMAPGNTTGQPPRETSSTVESITEAKSRLATEGDGSTTVLTNEEAQRKIRYLFVNNINPLTVLNVFHFYDQNVLVKQDIERVTAVTEQRGGFQGASELISILPRYNGWIPCLQKVLRHPNVKQQHIAVQIEAELGITYTPPDGAAGHFEPNETAEGDGEEVDFVQYFQQMQLKLGEQEHEIKSLQRDTLQYSGRERKLFKLGEDGLFQQMKTFRIEGEVEDCVVDIDKKLAAECTLNDGDKFFYHGTLERHVNSIWATGINLRKGKECRDFSNGSGFYVTEEVRDAIGYAENLATKMNVQEAAVMAFKIPRAMQMENHLDLHGDDKEKDWINVVEHFRGGENNRELKDALAEIKFIQGPVSCLCEDSGFAPNCVKSQLCILDENYALRFGQLQNIPCCFLFNANDVLLYDDSGSECH